VFAYVIEGSGYFDAEKKRKTGNEHLVIFKDGDDVKVAANDSVLRFLLISRSAGRTCGVERTIVMNHAGGIAGRF